MRYYNESRRLQQQQLNKAKYAERCHQLYKEICELKELKVEVDVDTEPVVVPVDA